jgi:hypothetical protein
MILAIIGTRRFSSPKAMRYAQLIITSEVLDLHWDSFVTGDITGSNKDGIDAAVKRICDAAGRECRIFTAADRTWIGGFKPRNILIAEACDELLCIRDPESSTYGSGWTAKHAKSLGKPVTRIEIS